MNTILKYLDKKVEKAPEEELYLWRLITRWYVEEGRDHTLFLVGKRIEGLEGDLADGYLKDAGDLPREIAKTKLKVYKQFLKRLAKEK